MVVDLPYDPRETQWELHDAIDAGARRVLLVWHRRAGKTVACVNQLVRSALTLTKEAPRFAYVAPLYRQAKTVAWDYLRRFSRPIPGVEIRESELRVDYPNGGRVQLFGADNPDSLRGMYLDGAVLDEYGQMHASLRGEVLTPALTDRGGYEIVCGTPKGQNQFYKLYQEAMSGVGSGWTVLYRPASKTGILNENQLQDALRQMGPETYEQEFECKWLAAARGTYYGKILEQIENEGRRGRVPHDPGLPVHTAWDLGIGDATSIWFCQRVGPEVRWIDYYEAEGEGLAFYASLLQQKAQQRKYVYADHLVPHDADHRSLQTGKTLVEMGKTLGLRMTVVPIHDLGSGIEATRQVLARSWFDREQTKPGWDGLAAYTRRFNARVDEFMDSPEHNWASHPADAARTFATAEVGRMLMRGDVGAMGRPRFARMG